METIEYQLHIHKLDIAVEKYFSEMLQRYNYIAIMAT